MRGEDGIESLRFGYQGSGWREHGHLLANGESLLDDRERVALLYSGKWSGRHVDQVEVRLFRVHDVSPKKTFVIIGAVVTGSFTTNPGRAIGDREAIRSPPRGLRADVCPGK